jgi:mitochondrial distribution and morphology protein 31
MNFLPSLRTLKTGITKRAGLLQHSRNCRRGVDAAVFDRYSVIRTFFRELHDPPWQNHVQSFRFNGNVVRLASVASSLIETRHHLHPRLIHTDAGNHTNPGPVRGKSPQGSPENPPKSNEPNLYPNPRNLENYPRFMRRLAASLPHLHRPSREDFLNISSGFWQRTLIRFRWLSIRSFRKFNADDISAFVTWFLMSQTLWILVGT